MRRGEVDDAADDEQVLLTIAASRFECDAVTSLLRSCGIRVCQGPGGGPRPPVDDNCVYVRRADLATATALMDAPVAWPD